jgi:hypothetical protein
MATKKLPVYTFKCVVCYGWVRFTKIRHELDDAETFDLPVYLRKGEQVGSGVRHEESRVVENMCAKCIEEGEAIEEAQWRREFDQAIEEARGQKPTLDDALDFYRRKFERN